MKGSKKSMTYKELLKTATERLALGNIENSRFDAQCLLEYCSQRDRIYIRINADKPVSGTLINSMANLLDRRISGEPLQYIIGEWEFFGFPFKVGEGVLIPRPETEMLVDYAVSLSIDAPVIFDLCAGSGCIGISVARMIPASTVYCVEKSKAAFAYLTENIKLNSASNVTAVCGDIFNGFKYFNLPKPDIILSNPPYIETSEIASLQKEVHAEPAEALDGGADGLDFYNCITEKWLPFTNYAAVECGENQAYSIAAMFKESNRTVEIFKDFNEIERVVAIRRNY